MGVPAFYRWLSQRYPKIIKPCIEEGTVDFNGVQVPTQYSSPNKNGELDNLYLDMNGIVHPCTHPEGRAPPATEQEMMVEVFRYTERVLMIARPRKVLMIALDGVAPRAKMNQQRSRRFRSAQDAKLAEEERQRQLAEAEARGETIDAAIKGKKAWDTNVITPGTPFMDYLAEALRYWVAYKLNTDPGWKDVNVIISDASVPGEGEHKIMKFIRSQRCDPTHDPNTSHCIYGLDADLIFLGLATHEPHFRILREDVFAQGRGGRKSSGPKPFLWLDVGILRQYLEIELDIPGTSFSFDLERAIDDWVFMAFFCGNDFLPHLPSLDVRENGIDALLRSWRQVLPRTKDYITCDGDVDLGRAQVLLRGVAAQEDTIFRQRRDQEARREANYQRNRNPSAKRQRTGPELGHTSTKGAETAPANPLDSMPLFTPKGESVGAVHMSNHDIALQIKRKRSVVEQTAGENESGEVKIEVKDEPVEEAQDEDEDDADPTLDRVRLGEAGYHERYYRSKFNVSGSDKQFIFEIVQKYVEGICWVLKYYYQGCPSWQWYYPYHYAPFAQDMVNLEDVKIEFNEGCPFRPYEQLMSVLPAASSHTLPEVFRPLMSDEDSPIIDFYPLEFPIDMNGKKMAWQGVALLPFIDETRLLTAVRAKYPELSESEIWRNGQREAVLLVAPDNPNRPKLASLYSSSGPRVWEFKESDGNGLAGTAAKLESWNLDSALPSPVSSLVGGEYPDLDLDRSVLVEYSLPLLQTHKSMLLQGFQENPLVLSNEDKEAILARRRRADRWDDRPVRMQRVDDTSEPRPLRQGGYRAYLQFDGNFAQQDAWHAHSYGANGQYKYSNFSSGYTGGNQYNAGYSSTRQWQGYQGYQGYQGRR